MKNNLIKLRTKRGLTQENLCAELFKINCCMCRSTYSKYETGKNEIPNETLVKFAIYFETSTDYILGLKDEAQ